MRPESIFLHLDANRLSFIEIVPEIVKHGYSRIPVYKDSIDSVMWGLYAKDLLPHLQKKQFDWTELNKNTFFCS